MTVRLAVFASGTGSNLDAIAHYLKSQAADATARFVVAISDRERSPALERARSHGAAAVVLGNPADPNRIAAVLREHDVQLIALAGYLRLLPARVVKDHAGRILNVHPALLPSFGGAGMFGIRVHKAVLDSGARVTGVTVHLVNEEYDRGRILAQWPVPVAADDSATTLAARVLRVEHVLYPRVVGAVAAALSSGQTGLATDAVPFARDSAFFLKQPHKGDIADEIERALALP
jgi:formyltetrahydrofolate-dependent phosphoribosylglycinamide formyltransferase